MLSFLAARECGIDPPNCLVRAETTRRAFSLELSKYFDVQKIHDGAINTLDIDPVEDRYLLSGATNGTIVIHDLHNISGVPQYTFPEVCHVGRGNRSRHKYSIETVQWYPLDTGMFVSSGMDKLLKVWDTNTLKTADEFEFNAGIYMHNMSSIAQQHSLIAVATVSSKVKLLDLKSGSSTHVLRGHRQPVYCTKWSTKDEFILATGSQDSKVMLWDIRSAKGALMVLDQHNGDTSAGPNSVNTAHDGHVNCVCFTPDGLHLVTYGTDNTLRLWVTATGENTMINYGKIRNECRRGVSVTMCETSKPELVFVPSESDIIVYDLFSGNKVNTLRGHYNQVNCCMLQSNYQYLYSCGNDRNILIWKPFLGTHIAYENHLCKSSSDKTQTKSGFVRPIGTADAWSSDEG